MPELAKGLKDKFYRIKTATIQKLASSPYKADPVVLEEIELLAKKDNNSKVRAAAINFLVKNGDKKYASIYETAINDSSYTVAGAALKGLTAIQPENALALAKKYAPDAKGELGKEVNSVLLDQGTEADFDMLDHLYRKAPLSQEKVGLTDKFGKYLIKVNDLAKVKKGIDAIMLFRNAIPEQFRGFVDQSFKSTFDKIAAAKGKEIEEYVKSVFK